MFTNINCLQQVQILIYKNVQPGGVVEYTDCTFAEE